MIRFLALLVLLLIPDLGRAQTVSIRSGEHADFSRLVLNFEERLDWKFGRVEGGYELRVDQSDLSFDISRVFDLIPRTRIEAVEDRGDGRLFIRSSCACHGDAFDLRQSEVVLDVKDGPPLHAANPFNKTLPKWVGSVSSDRPAKPDTDTPPAPLAVSHTIAPPSFIARDGLPTGFAPPFSDLPAVPGPEVPALTAPPFAGVTVTDVIPPPSDRVSEAEEALLRQIGRAAAQGLLDADLTATEDAVQTALHPIPADEPEASPTEEVPTPPPPAAADPYSHMHVETVMDRDLGHSMGSEAPRTREGHKCLPPAHFDLSSWGSPPKNGADMSLHRAALLGEFDAAKSEHVLGLAQHYIYLTFGAEAVAVARRFEADLTRPDLLIMMGQIMDHGASQFPAAIVDQLDCAGPVALWAALAQPELPAGAEIDEPAIIQAFSELPLHLRRHLGPGLADKFLELGDTTTASALRDSIARAPGSHGASFDLMEAQLDLSHGAYDRASEALGDIVREDGPIAPQALLELVQARLQAGLEIDRTTLELATAMAYEQRGTELGSQLLGAAISADAAMGMFDDAFLLWDEAAATLGTESPAVVALHVELLKKVTDLAEDKDFLRHIVPDTKQVQMMPRDLRQAIAARLLDLGFVAAARDALSNPRDIPGPEDRLLFARVALLEGKPGVAMGYLAGLETDEAIRLKAQAYTALADHKAAAQNWTRVEEEQASWQASWLAGDWERLQADEDNPYHDIAQIMAQPMAPEGEAPREPDADAPSVMAIGQDALAHSQEVRTALGNLLTRTGTP